MPIRYSYGADRSQYAELYLPCQRRYEGVVVVIHGGYWRSAYTAELGAPIAADLAAHGIVAWNLEYRRAGKGGGWPQTFADVSAGIDALRPVAAEHALKLDCVVALGHSAGGQLAVWAAGRDKLPPGAPGSYAAAGKPTGRTVVPLTAVVSQSGVLDLRQAMELNLSDGAVRNFLGRSPESSPERYRLADPLQQIPLKVPVYAVAAAADVTVPPSLSRDYVASAQVAGAVAELIPVPGDHFDLIDVRSEAFAVCRSLVSSALSRSFPEPHGNLT
ncbi:alpha/beta hydrolase [Paeniglutamicibacter antarcticus]|uniref:Alpha/beta hydrolase n=1 Tax=Arthrobacter terrae TaxID=2935737 RepID=A0A931G818_9MICC|nr:alpha/beta hydrolase [Arthrobacter terrae]MBG0739844.1 alpha/beta hydrolase [Arthrobacter terrae]